MANNANKEKWINEVMDSIHGMTRAIPHIDLFAGVPSKSADRSAVNVIQLPVKQWAAAAIILLALNIGSMVYFSSRNRRVSTAAAVNPLASELQLETSYNY
jgi:hypothetical protein